MCQTCNDSRTGPSWTQFLARYRLRNICNEEGDWRVESASGATYHVRSITPRHEYDRFGEPQPLFVMVCDCPARKRCRHIEAVMEMRYAEELAAAQGGDADGMEILERTEA